MAENKKPIWEGNNNDDDDGKGWNYSGLLRVLPAESTNSVNVVFNESRWLKADKKIYWK